MCSGRNAVRRHSVVGYCMPSRNCICYRCQQVGWRYNRGLLIHHAVRLPFVQSFSFEQTALTSHPGAATLLLATCYLALVSTYNYTTSRPKAAAHSAESPHVHSQSPAMTWFLRVWNLSLCVASLVMLVGMALPKLQKGSHHHCALVLLIRSYVVPCWMVDLPVGELVHGITSVIRS